MLETDKMVYLFSEGSAGLKNLLGGKGANLSEISRLGLPVPPGFVITTEACRKYFNSGNKIWPELEQEIRQGLARLEQETGRKFGSARPLLLSVRSGAVVSMPGMMDTILNLGLNSSTLEGLAEETSNRRFALDCYRRFIQMFAEVVFKIRVAVTFCKLYLYSIIIERCSNCAVVHEKPKTSNIVIITNPTRITASIDK